MNSWLDSQLHTIVKYSLTVMIFSLAITILMAYGFKNLHVETDYRIFFSADDPNLAADEQLKAIYGKSDNILFVVHPHNGDIFSPDNLASIEELTEMAWQIPHSRRVDSVTNFQYPSVEGDDIQIENLVQDARSYSNTKSEEIRNIALKESGLVGRLVAIQGNSAAVNVTLELPDASGPATAEAVKAARDIKRKLEASNPSISIYLAGLAVTEQTFSDIATSDAQTLIPLMFTIVFLLLSVLLRSISATLCTIAIIVVGVIAGMGFAGWYGYAINNVNISAPTIIMTLGIADCVHVFNVFLRKYIRGTEKSDALIASLKLNKYPIFLTSLTTALGFMTMNFSESPPFRELGNIAAAGVLGAFFATFFLLPGLIMLLPFKQVERETAVNAFSARLSEFVIAHYNKLFLVLLACNLLAIGFLTKIELNDNPIGYFSRDTPVRQASEYIEKNLSGTQIIYYSLNSGSADGILDPSFLKSSDTFINWLRSQPEVVNVESINDVLKRFNQILHEDDQNWYRLPDSRELSAQYFLMYELSLPYGLDVSNQVSRDKSSVKITAILKNQNSAGLIAFERRVQDWFARELPKLATHGASHSLSFAHIGQRNIESMLLGSLVAILLISSVLVLAFRSFTFGLVSFIPNLFPALATLGIWGALVTEINMAASVVFSVTLGIIVDDTVHFLVKYIEARREQNCDVETAIRYSFNSVGGALLSTSVVLAIGFLVLSFSNFTVNSTTGLLVAITIAIALVLDLLFLPSILLKFSRR